MPEHFTKCRCQHCDKGIEFDADGFSDNETRQFPCPHCGLETIIFVAKAQEQKPSLFQKLKAKKHWILGYAAAAAILGLIIWASHKHPEIYKQIAAGAGGLIGLAVAIVLIVVISKANGWMTVFTVGLFISGAFSIAIGTLVALGIVLAKEATVFQEYEAIFLCLGGLVVIALSLILSAVLSQKESK